MSNTNPPIEKMSPTSPYYEIEEDLIAELEHQKSPKMAEYNTKLARAKNYVISKSLRMSENFGEYGNPKSEFLAETAFYRLVEAVVIFNNLKKTRPRP